MSADDPDARPPRRLRRWVAIVALGMVAIGGVGWVERRPVIRHFLDDEFGRRHVPARYTLADVGLGRQRLTNVVIGDPANPDLVADWIETQVGYGITGPTLVGIRAGHVRLRGRLVDGRLSLGSLDRLLPAPSTAKRPLLLPAIALAIADGRMRLETPIGPIDLALSGQGRLDGGFTGVVAAVAPTLGERGCAVTSPRLTGRVSALTPQRGASRILLDGPLGWRRAACRQFASGAGTAALDVMVSSRAVTGRSGLDVVDIAAPGLVAARLAGSVTLSGTLAAPAGTADLVASMLRTDDVTARQVSAVGRYETVQPGFVGTIGWRSAAVPGLAAIARRLAVPAGTPVTPLAAGLMRAMTHAGQSVDGSAAVVVERGRVTVRSAHASSASGARLTFDGPMTIGAIPVGRLAIDGGGLPAMALALDGGRQGSAGTLTIARYAAGGAVLAPATLGFVRDGAGWRVAGDIMLSGPLGAGRVDQLRLPLTAVYRRSGIGVLTACTPIGAARLTLGSLTLDQAAATLCPTGSAIVTTGRGRTVVAARLSPLNLAGTLGGAPLTLTAQGGLVAATGVTIDRLAATLGPPGRQSRLAIDRLDGVPSATGFAGRFTGAGGAIGAVPLALSGAAGDWRFGDGVLALTGTLTIADAANPKAPCTPPFGADAPRFCPIEARGVRLSLADGRISATGSLYAPGTTVRIADVALRHDLSSGGGHAGFAIRDLAFTRDFQPDRLTPATFGIVADVKGSVSGDAAIDWSGDGVASNGRFTTGGLDLAAAFGPVTGISGTIDFDDLLALATPPGQQLSVASINPGVAVTDGIVTYQLRPDSIVAVAGARWPFAGGTLTLDPTTLDLAHPVAKRLTFRIDGMQAAQFLQQFNFQNLDATGIFDGVLPMVFDEAGGRIENGELKVRPGGGTIAYVGDLTEKDLGFWGNLAFQALKSLRYRSLDIQMNGPLAGEMVTAVRFAGVQQGKGAHANFLIRRLEKLPFVFNITIRAPFRGLIDSVQSFYDPRRLVDRLLPAPSAGQVPAVQPAASAPVAGTPLTPPRQGARQER